MHEEKTFKKLSFQVTEERRVSKKQCMMKTIILLKTLLFWLLNVSHKERIKILKQKKHWVNHL